MDPFVSKRGYHWHVWNFERKSQAVAIVRDVFYSVLEKQSSICGSNCKLPLALDRHHRRGFCTGSRNHQLMMDAYWH